MVAGPAVAGTSHGRVARAACRRRHTLVHFRSPGHIEAFVTQVTCVGLLACVYELVLLQTTILMEGFAANVAPVGLLASVKTHVPH